MLFIFYFVDKTISTTKKAITRQSITVKPMLIDSADLGFVVCVSTA
jgi:hypothetical protein